tara:strand:+ start:526 stop:768 length:243 start_codon:yes stop_codon:yes gene_type:complete
MKLIKVIKLIELIGDSTIPVDIKKHLDEEHYSKSKDAFMKIGDMDLYHYIRSHLKDNKNIWDDSIDKANKLAKIKEILED